MCVYERERERERVCEAGGKRSEGFLTLRQFDGPSVGVCVNGSGRAAHRLNRVKRLGFEQTHMPSTITRAGITQLFSSSPTWQAFKSINFLTFLALRYLALLSLQTLDGVTLPTPDLT